MSKADRTICEDIPGALDDVRAFYTDLANIKRVHPLVVAVRSVERSDTSDGYRQTYRVTDRIPLGPLHLRASYIARLYVPRTGDVLTEARQFPRVRLTGRVSFERAGAATRVTERIAIEAPRPLAPMTVRKAVEAHTEMLAAMRRLFEGGANQRDYVGQ